MGSGRTLALKPPKKIIAKRVTISKQQDIIPPLMASMSMEELMKSYSGKTLSLGKGDQVEGEVVNITQSEVIMDLGVKSEGLLSKKDFIPQDLEKLKPGDKLTVFILGENSSGLLELSLYKPVETKGRSKGPSSKNWGKFLSALRTQGKMGGSVVEKNKGGFLVEVDSVRGFLPFSQLSSKEVKNLDNLVGSEVELWVVEVDEKNNKLIFKSIPPVSTDLLSKLESVKSGEKKEVEVAAVLPIGLLVKLEDLEGFIKVSELSWEKVEDPSILYKEGDKLEAVVTGIDKIQGRVNLSLKTLKEDPFDKISEKFQSDDVVKGVVTEVTQNGVNIQLEEGILGFLPSDKIEGTKYEIGQSTNFLVDSVDKVKRRILLAPFFTSTIGLIYK